MQSDTDADCHLARKMVVVPLRFKTFCLGLFERDAFILDQCAMAEINRQPKMQLI